MAFPAHPCHGPSVTGPDPSGYLTCLVLVPTPWSRALSHLQGSSGCHYVLFPAPCYGPSWQPWLAPTYPDVGLVSSSLGLLYS